MGNILKNLDWSVLTDILYYVIPALVCITLHELAHGFVAYKLGDNTARRAGRLTLNPLRHIDPVGLLMMVIVHFGWAKPVPVDMRNFKNPKRGMAVTALAGPLANVLISLVSLLLYGFLYVFLYSSAAGSFALNLIYITAYLSLSLAVFNLIPIPPLDGSKILFSVISDRAYDQLMRYERYGMILLVVIMVTGALTNVLGTVLTFLFDRFFVVAQWANGLTLLFM